MCRRLRPMSNESIESVKQMLRDGAIKFLLDTRFTNMAKILGDAKTSFVVCVCVCVWWTIHDDGKILRYCFFDGLVLPIYDPDIRARCAHACAREANHEFDESRRAQLWAQGVLACREQRWIREHVLRVGATLRGGPTYRIIRAGKIMGDKTPVRHNFLENTADIHIG